VHKGCTADDDNGRDERIAAAVEGARVDRADLGAGGCAALRKVERNNAGPEGEQELWLYEGGGRTSLGPVRFVPFLPGTA
jgi:hypothetical protein